MTTTDLLQTVTPDQTCPSDDGRPTFSWRVTGRHPAQRAIASYYLKVVALTARQDAVKALAANTAVLEVNDINRTTLDFPARSRPLTPGNVYAFRVSALDAAGKVLGTSNISLFYVAPAGLPFRLSELLCCRGGLLKSSASAWQIAYGAPQIHPQAKSCPGESGTILMSGDRAAGDAVYQAVNGGLVAGQRYRFRFCARWVDKGLDYVKFRLVAFNGSLPAGGHHPDPGPDIQIIGETAPITSGDWAYLFLPPWRAPRAFTAVAILAVTDSGRDAGWGTGEISGICLAEYSHDDCGDIAGISTAGGEINLPDSLMPYADPNHNPEGVPVGFGRGRVVDIAGDMFGSGGELNWYRADDPCESFGGEIPPEATQMPEEEIDLGGGYTLEDIEKMSENVLAEIGKDWDLSPFEPIPPEKDQNCRPFRPDKKLPFGGRDIIYIHGFQPGHVMGHISRRFQLETNGNSSIEAGVEDRYPQQDIATGYYGQAAKSYWHYHIGRYLGEVDQPSNRYLVVSFNSNQRLIENVHAVLKQIRDAMSDGTGVVYNDEDDRQGACFGRDCVIVTHSTGALVADVALSLAAQSATEVWVRNYLGDVTFIPDRVAAHVSLHGAIAGSELGALAVVGANALAAAAPAVDGAVDVGIMGVDIAAIVGPMWLRLALAAFNREVSLVTSLADAMTDQLNIYARHAVAVVNRGILVDLTPIVAKTLWGETINATPVPTLTVAGGHPIDPADFQIAAKVPLRGFDDGVVNTSSQSGSPSLIHPDKYVFLAPVARIYDMGLHPVRGLIYFADQYRGPNLAAFGSVPWLSPAGMVQPLASSSSPLPRYGNHFTFLQSASDHQAPIDTPPADMSWQAHEYKRTLGRHNHEETLVISEAFVFNTGLVDPAIISLVQECVRGMDLVIRLRIPLPRFTLSPPSFTITYLTLTATIPLWRRRYHHLKATNDCYPWNYLNNELATLGDFLTGSEPRHECDYVYRFVLNA
jgi:hypothetical protein